MTDHTPDSGQTADSEQHPGSQMPDGRIPSVGRIVRYQSYGTRDGEHRPESRPATVAEVGAWVTVETRNDNPDESPQPGDRRTLEQVWDPEACALVVQNPTGLFFNTCRHDEGRAGGTWHWPVLTG